MAEELFADYAPTPGYAARLKATAAQQATAPQLVALAEQQGDVEVLVSCAGVMYFTLMKNQHEEE